VGYDKPCPGGSGPSQTSKLSQTFVVPTGDNYVNFVWYPSCVDPSADIATITLKDVTAATSVSVSDNACRNPQPVGWYPGHASVIQGHKMTLIFLNHDDNDGTDGSVVLVDNVTLSASPQAPSASMQPPPFTSVSASPVTRTW
jgi:hypothetical protein